MGNNFVMEFEKVMSHMKSDHKHLVSVVLVFHWDSGMIVKKNIKKHMQSDLPQIVRKHIFYLQ